MKLHYYVESIIKYPPMNSLKAPVVLVFAGHDPSGAAGIQADMETIAANEVKSVSVITALTSQNTASFTGMFPQDATQFRSQTELLLDDIHVDACKIGLLANEDIVGAIAETLHTLVDTPVVLDPVLRTGVGTIVFDHALLKAIKKQLLPLTTMLTPNISEARQLTGEDSINLAAEKLLQWGCEHVLITGADEKTDKVINRFFSKTLPARSYEWPRLPDQYHGSGCTLSSSIAAQLALAKDIMTSIEIAQEFTWQSLEQAIQLGKVQKHPNRYFKFSNE